MAFPAIGANPITQSLGSARGAVKVTKSLTLNVFGKAYNATNGGDARACEALCVGTAGTATFIDATGTLCTDFPLQAGINPIKVIQIKTGGTADDIWALF